MRYSNLVHHFLEDSAERFPDKEAFFAQGHWYSYSHIERQANQLARFLIEQGLERGERVAFSIENSLEYVITYYAVLKTGAITVALNTELTGGNVAYILQDCDVKILIAGKKTFPKLKEIITPERMKVFLLWADKTKIAFSPSGVRFYYLPEQLEGFQQSRPGRKMIDLDVASIVYTSGSTGKPRGATLSHLNIVTNTRSITDYLELSARDRVMVILPFYYIYGKSLLNTHFFIGGSVVTDNRFTFPNAVLKTMREQQATGLSGVPSTFTVLLNRSNLRTQNFPALRYVTQAGGAMAPVIQKEVAAVFAPAKLFIMYGATEASARLSYLSPADLPRKWGSIGKAIPNVELFIADAHGRALPAGTEGEIVARGANIMRGYWHHPEETRKVLKHGLYYTGDLGVMDEEGFLFVVGRSKDMIKIGGNRVSAKEIEDALYEHPMVADAAVIGVSDEILGEAPKAFVVLKNYVDAQIAEETIKNFIKSKLASYKIPKYFEFRDTLPKNKSGKIQKLKLSQKPL